MVQGSPSACWMGIIIIRQWDMAMMSRPTNGWTEPECPVGDGDCINWVTETHSTRGKHTGKGKHTRAFNGKRIRRDRGNWMRSECLWQARASERPVSRHCQKVKEMAPQKEHFYHFRFHFHFHFHLQLHIHLQMSRFLLLFFFLRIPTLEGEKESPFCM